MSITIFILIALIITAGVLFGIYYALRPQEKLNPIQSPDESVIALKVSPWTSLSCSEILDQVHLITSTLEMVRVDEKTYTFWMDEAEKGMLIYKKVCENKI